MPTPLAPSSGPLDLTSILGKFIGSMHEWSRTNPDNILNVFDKNVAAKEASADYYCDRIVARLQKSDNLPVLADLEVDASGI